MNIIIEKQMIEKYSSIRLGILQFETIVKEKNQSLWDKIETQAIPEILTLLENTNIPDLPAIGDSRRAYKAFGKDPARYRISSESLIRRIKQGKGLYQVNSIVDTNNLISIESGFSVGSYDLSNIAEEITFTLGKAGESYKGIGKDSIHIENMPVLADAKGPFGSPTSDSERAMITLESKNILMVIYCFSESINLENVMEKAEKYLSDFAQAQNIIKWIVSK